MIKINLRPDIASTIEGVEAPVDQVDVEIQRKGLVHILVICILPVALYVYGAQAKPQKEREIQSLNSQIAEFTAFNDKQTAIVTEITKIKSDEKDVENKIHEISNLTQGRLVEIKVLDLLQTIIRDKMWLKQISVDTQTDKNDIAISNFSIEGMAQSEMDVSIFLDDLTKNVLLRDVRLIESQQEVYEGQNFSRFKIAAVLEKSK